jgi:hypothetical protein
MSMRHPPNMRLGSIILVLVLQSFSGSSCSRGVLVDGDYFVSFQWDEKAIAKAEIKKNSETGPKVTGIVEAEVRKISQDVIKTQMEHANLRVGSGILQMRIAASSPYFTSIQRFDITRPGFGDLASAVERQDSKAIQEIVSQYHNVNQKDLVSQDTALEVAAAGGSIESLCTLLRLGADPNISNRLGDTPLIMAAANGNEQIVKTLIEAGADANAKNKAGESAISIAARLKHMRILHLLSPQKSLQPQTS